MASQPPRKFSPLKARPEPPKKAPSKPEPDNPARPPKQKLKAKAAKPPLAVIVNGTNAEGMGIPLMMESASQAAVLNNLICREILHPSGPLEPLSTTVTTLQDTVNAMSRGTDIAPFKDHIQRVAANQPEKGDVIRAYLNQLDHELIADLAVMRANSMRFIKRASSRSDITVGEALVIWRMCNEQLPDLKKGLSSDKPVDTVTVVQKIDYRQQQIERSVQHQWEGTTPQGRELIRKKLWEVKREVLAKLNATENAEQPKA